MKKIGIVIKATNAYFVLGVKFIKRFAHFHEGDYDVQFFFFSDTDPKPYLPDHINVKYIHEEHEHWVHGTDSKFKNILLLEQEDVDYLYYFDADTNVIKPFTCEWMIGELVGGEHFANRDWMRDKKGFDRYPKSQAYVPFDTTLPQMYYYGAFFGGEKYEVIKFCNILRQWQLQDQKIGYEPSVNDESYINKYFHYYPPTTVTQEKFAFHVSDKSGIGDTRDMNLPIDHIKQDLLKYKNSLINISEGKVYEV